MTLTELLRPRLERLSPDLREVIEPILFELERQGQMRQEFDRLMQRFDALDATLEALAREVWKAIHELAAAQARTEQRVEELTQAQARTEQRLEELAQAQERTEQRLEELAQAQARTEQRLEELAEAQVHTEARMSRLEQAIARLTEAQERTEKRLEKLAQAQEQVEERVSRLERALAELAEAQQRTEEELRGLGQYTQMLHQRLEGLSNAVGYSLENRAYLALPAILARRYGLRVEGELRRRYITVGRKTRQINIYGYARRNGERVLIVGEAKVRPSRSEVQRLRKLCQKLEAQEGLPVVPVFVAHDFPPAVERVLEAERVLAVWSYDIDREVHRPAHAA